MALKLNKQKGSKTIQYWRIVRLYFNVDEKHLIAELRGYESKAKSDSAKAGAKTAEEELQFTMSGADFPNTDKAKFMNDVYAFIKKSMLYGIDWKQAVDV